MYTVYIWCISKSIKRYFKSESIILKLNLNDSGRWPHRQVQPQSLKFCQWYLQLTHYLPLKPNSDDVLHCSVNIDYNNGFLPTLNHCFNKCYHRWGPSTFTSRQFHRKCSQHFLWNCLGVKVLLSISIKVSFLRYIYKNITELHLKISYH